MSTFTLKSKGLSGQFAIHQHVQGPGFIGGDLSLSCIGKMGQQNMLIVYGKKQ